MPHPEGYVESAQEIYDREYPEGSLKRQEHEREIQQLQAQTEVPEDVWRSEATPPGRING